MAKPIPDNASAKIQSKVLDCIPSFASVVSSSAIDQRYPSNSPRTMPKSAEQPRAETRCVNHGIEIQDVAFRPIK